MKFQSIYIYAKVSRFLSRSTNLIKEYNYPKKSKAIFHRIFEKNCMWKSIKKQ